MFVISCAGDPPTTDEQVETLGHTCEHRVLTHHLLRRAQRHRRDPRTTAAGVATLCGNVAVAVVDTWYDTRSGRIAVSSFELVRVEPDGDRQTHDRTLDETAYHRVVKAELVACIELGGRGARQVAKVEGRLLVVTDDAIHEVAGDTLVPMIASIDVIDLSRHLVLTPRHLVEIGGATHALPPLDGAVPAALEALPDGAIVAVCEQRDQAAAAVLRLGRDGRLIWRTATPPPATLLETRSLRLADGVETPGQPLEATQWTIFRGNLCVSGDRVLAVFADAQRTGIAVAYGLDLATGALVYTTPAAPYDQLAPGPLDGQFVLGVQGYGAFRSVLVDRDGRALLHWDSQGISISRDPLRVLEMENISPSRCRIATLGRDGSVHHGAHLPGYHTSPVVVAPDGAAVFWRNNAVMRASPDGDRIERLLETPTRARAWSDGFAGRAPGRVALALSARGVLDGALSERYRLFVIDLVA